MTSLETVFAEIKITFFTDVWCFCFFIFACTIFFINTSSWVHELVQPYLDNTANPNLEAYITRCQRPSIPSVMLSGKNFPSSNYPTRKSCVVCAYEKNNAGKYEKTPNFWKKLFRAISYPQSTEKEINYMMYLQWE